MKNESTKWVNKGWNKRRKEEKKKKIRDQERKVQNRMVCNERRY